MYLHSPFPAVADAVQSELEQYKQSEEEVKRLKDAMVTIHVYAVCVCTHICEHCDKISSNQLTIAS